VIALLVVLTAAVQEPPVRRERPAAPADVPLAPAAEGALIDMAAGAAGVSGYEAGLDEGYRRGREDAADGRLRGDDDVGSGVGGGGVGGGAWTSPDGRIMRVTADPAEARRLRAAGWRRLGEGFGENRGRTVRRTRRR